MMQVSVVDRYKRRTVFTERNHTIAWQVLSFPRQLSRKLSRLGRRGYRTLSHVLNDHVRNMLN
jgi:hypothetical protein